MCEIALLLPATHSYPIPMQFRFDDPTVAADMKQWPFKVVRASRDRPVIEVQYKGQTKRFFAEEILAMFFAFAKQCAEAYLQTTVTDAVISVPCSFNFSQRTAMKNAAKIAGLCVLRAVASPSLAAIAYGLDSDRWRSDKEKLVLVFDLGGGTLDVSLVSVDSGVFEVKATAGDTHLGGDDFDGILLDFMARSFEQRHKVSCTRSKRSMSRLRKQCTKAKHTLSVATKAYIEIDALFDGIDFEATITRAQFEELCTQRFRECLAPVTKVLQNVLYAKCTKSDVQEIVLIGSASRTLKIQEMLQVYFGGKDLCKSINPNEAVAIGAAAQAAIISGTANEFLENALLLDVAPFSLGMTKMIDRNKAIPCKVNETFTTQVGGQSQVLIQVFEGERQLTKHDNCLARFTLNLQNGTSDASSVVCECEETKEEKSEDDASSSQKAKQCPLCSKEFGFLNRRHHCRTCGGLVCAKCSKHKLASANGKAERACDQCYLAANTEADAPKSVIVVQFDLEPNDKLTVKVFDKSDPSNAVQRVCTGSSYGTLDDAEMVRMTREAQQNQKEEAEMRDTLAARDKLESALFELRQAVHVEDAKLKHLDQEAKQAVLDRAQAVEDWMDVNVDARRMDYELKRDEIERMWHPSNDEQKHDDALHEKMGAVKGKRERVASWLKGLGMEQYTELFFEEGYDDMDVIVQTMGDEDLKEIGLKKRGHRAKIMLWIKRFNAQQEEEFNDEGEGGETVLF